MRIDNVIMSVNDHPNYQRLWPLLSAVWKTRFNIEPILFWTSDSFDFPHPSKYGKIIRVPLIKNVDEVKQAQLARMWGCTEITGVNMISDMDMFPVSKWYFIDQLEKYSRSSFIHMDLVENESRLSNKLSMCYNIGSMETYIEIFTRSNFNDFVNRVLPIYSPQRWDGDELFLYECVKKHDKEIVFLPRWEWRHCFAHHLWNELIQPEEIEFDRYYDLHILPIQEVGYNTLKQVVENLLSQ